MKKLELTFSIKKKTLSNLNARIEKHAISIIVSVLSVVSILSFLYFHFNGLSVAYNDARSHLDIGRRVVEGLKPGFAQIGSVWLPLPHILMIPTIWNDFMWHTGLAGSIQSMIAYVYVGVLIYLFLKRFGAGLYARFIGVLLYAANINVLYLQSTAMTELLLLATMMGGTYYLIRWHDDGKLTSLMMSAFFIMLSTLSRYDGWFLLFMATVLVLIQSRRNKVKGLDGVFFFFCTLSGVGVVLWFLWNLLIFKDPFYFAFGPFSAHSQQLVIEEAGGLPTKGNIIMSLKVYFFALLYNTYTIPAILGFIGAVVLFFDKKIKKDIRIASIVLLSPFIYNVLALYLGHSVLFVQGISGNTWFNVRYGMLVIPSFAILAAYLMDRIRHSRFVFTGGLFFVFLFAFINMDGVTIDDARYGASQKNVSEVSGYLEQNVLNPKDYVLVSAASHDAVIFSSNLPMKQFIHEGTGEYWNSAIENPDHWARWIIMRTNDESDMTWRLVKNQEGFKKYRLVNHYPFADIYELEPEYQADLASLQVLPQK